MIELHHGDCLDVMSSIPDDSVDMILCDLPYGTTACKWDSVIPFEPLWEQYRRLIKGNGAIVLTASQPFTTALIASNYGMFKYCWVWEKSKASNFVRCKKEPLKAHEDIVVFGAGGLLEYHPRMTDGEPYKPRPGKKITEVYNQPSDHMFRNGSDGKRYPRSVQYFATAESEGSVEHPTQKPVVLMEYLIRTYTNPGDVVMDNCMGSGTTGVACVNTGRGFIGIERDPDYFKIAENRIYLRKAETL